MSGGWHDAGDLSQGLINTGEATYAMFALAERLKLGGENGDLYPRLVEEAKWGLGWVLRVVRRWLPNRIRIAQPLDEQHRRRRG